MSHHHPDEVEEDIDYMKRVLSRPPTERLAVAAELISVAALKMNTELRGRHLRRGGGAGGNHYVTPISYSARQAILNREDGTYQLLELNSSRLFILIATILDLSKPGTTTHQEVTLGGGKKRQQYDSPFLGKDMRDAFLSATVLDISSSTTTSAGDQNQQQQPSRAQVLRSRQEELFNSVKGVPFNNLFPLSRMLSPTLRNYIGTERRITAHLLSGVASRNVVTAWELQQEICRLENVAFFDDLKMGTSIFNFEPVRSVFKVQETDTLVPHVTAKDFYAFCALDASAQHLIRDTGADCSALLDCYARYYNEKMAPPAGRVNTRSATATAKNGRQLGIHIEDFPLVLAAIAQSMSMGNGNRKNDAEGRGDGVQQVVVSGEEGAHFMELAARGLEAKHEAQRATCEEASSSQQLQPTTTSYSTFKEEEALSHHQQQGAVPAQQKVPAAVATQPVFSRQEDTPPPEGAVTPTTPSATAKRSGVLTVKDTRTDAVLMAPHAALKAAAAAPPTTPQISVAEAKQKGIHAAKTCYTRWCEDIKASLAPGSGITQRQGLLDDVRQLLAKVKSHCKSIGEEVSRNRTMQQRMAAANEASMEEDMNPPPPSTVVNTFSVFGSASASTAAATVGLSSKANDAEAKRREEQAHRISKELSNEQFLSTSISSVRKALQYNSHNDDDAQTTVTSVDWVALLETNAKVKQFRSALMMLRVLVIAVKQLSQTEKSVDLTPLQEMLNEDESNTPLRTLWPMLTEPHASCPSMTLIEEDAYQPWAWNMPLMAAVGFSLQLDNIKGVQRAISNESQHPSKKARQLLHRVEKLVSSFRAFKLAAVTQYCTEVLPLKHADQGSSQVAFGCAPVHNNQKELFAELLHLVSAAADLNEEENSNVISIKQKTTFLEAFKEHLSPLKNESLLFVPLATSVALAEATESGVDAFNAVKRSLTRSTNSGSVGASESASLPENIIKTSKPVLGFFCRPAELPYSYPPSLFSAARATEGIDDSSFVLNWTQSRLLFVADDLHCFHNDKGNNDEDEQESVLDVVLCPPGDPAPRSNLEDGVFSFLSLGMPERPTLSVFRFHMTLLRSIQKEWSSLYPKPAAMCVAALSAGGMHQELLHGANTRASRDISILTTMKSVLEASIAAARPLQDALLMTLCFKQHFEKQGEEGPVADGEQHVGFDLSSVILALNPLEQLFFVGPTTASSSSSRDSETNVTATLMKQWKSPAEKVLCLYGSIGAKLASTVRTPDRKSCEQSYLASYNKEKASNVFGSTDSEGDDVPNDEMAEQQQLGEKRKRRRRPRRLAAVSHPTTNGANQAAVPMPEGLTLQHATSPNILWFGNTPPLEFLEFVTSPQIGLIDPFSLNSSAASSLCLITLGNLYPHDARHLRVMANVHCALPYIQHILMHPSASLRLSNDDHSEEAPLPNLLPHHAAEVGQRLSRLAVVPCDWMEAIYSLKGDDQSSVQASGGSGGESSTVARCSCHETRMERSSEYVPQHNTLYFTIAEDDNLALSSGISNGTVKRVTNPPSFINSVLKILIPETLSNFPNSKGCELAESVKKKVRGMLSLIIQCLNDEDVHMILGRQERIPRFNGATGKEWSLSTALSRPPDRYRTHFVPGTAFTEVGIPPTEAQKEAGAKHGRDIEYGSILDTSSLPEKRVKREQQHPNAGGGGAGSSRNRPRGGGSIHTADSHVGIDAQMEQEYSETIDTMANDLVAHGVEGTDAYGSPEELSLAGVFAKREMSRKEKDQELLEHSYATAGRNKKTGQDASEDHYSRRAELHCFHLVSQELGPDQRAVWVNDRGESGFPYDIVIRQRARDGQGEVDAYYIEVKATSTRNRSVLEMSIPELIFAAQHRSCFSVFRVFNALQLSPQGHPTVRINGQSTVSVQRLHDIVALWESHKVNFSGDVRCVILDQK